MSDPNYPPQPSYPSPASQTSPQQYSSQQPQSSPYVGQQYAQNPQANPYAGGQQYAQPAPQYGQTPYQQPQYAPQYAPVQPARPVDSGSFGWAVLGFFIPLVGLILYLVWRNEKPLSAKKAGMGALVSILLSVALWVLMFMMLTFGVATYSATL